MKIQTTNKEILDTYRMLTYNENNLWGNLAFGASKFNNMHNILDIRVAGIVARETKLKEEFFEMVNGQVQFDTTPAEKEGEEPKSTPRLKEGKTIEDYKLKYSELMDTPIEISREQ